MTSSERHLIVFARPPERGLVKTRLASTAGNDKALEIYTILLEKTRQILLQLPVKRHIYLTHIPDSYHFWDDVSDNMHCQTAGHLGNKMRHALLQTEEKSMEKYSSKIIIGTDCPDMNSALLLKAFDALQHSDVVMGPTHDGGYYLIGMKEVFPDLFEEVPWSTDQVMKVTLDKISAHGLKCTLLETLTDIDYEEDWRQWLSFSNQKGLKPPGI